MPAHDEHHRCAPRSRADQPIKTIGDGRSVRQPLARKPCGDVGLARALFVKAHADCASRIVTGAAHDKAVRIAVVVEKVLALIGRAVAEGTGGQATRCRGDAGIQIARIDCLEDARSPEACCRKTPRSRNTRSTAFAEATGSAFTAGSGGMSEGHMKTRSIRSAYRLCAAPCCGSRPAGC